MNCICPYCNTPSEFYFTSKDYNRKVTDEIFKHYRCPSCLLIFINPIPYDLGEYYPNDYHYIPETIEFLENNTQHEQYKIKIIKKFKEKGTLLEIGPSLGTFVFAAKKAGYSPYAIEMNSACSAYLNEVAKIPTINSDNIESALEKLDDFDVITLWHVIEHLEDPWTILERLSNKLNSNGLIVLAAPNPDSFQFKIQKKHWPHVDAPRHIYLIPTTILEEKLRDLGFTKVLSTTNDEGGLGWNVFGWEYYFSNLSSNSIIKYLLSKVGKFIAYLLSPFDEKEGRGAAYTMVFKKTS